MDKSTYINITNEAKKAIKVICAKAGISMLEFFNRLSKVPEKELEKMIEKNK